MYTKAKDLPTVIFPEEPVEFNYNTSWYKPGEKVHLFEDPYHSGYSINVLTDSGLLVSAKELVICQKKYFTKKQKDSGKRYLGIGIIHTGRA